MLVFNIKVNATEAKLSSKHKKKEKLASKLFISPDKIKRKTDLCSSMETISGKNK